jgi:hypothetical protein
MHRIHGRVNQLLLDLPTHIVWTSFPKPQSGMDWDGLDSAQNSPLIV